MPGANGARIKNKVARKCRFARVKLYLIDVKYKIKSGVNYRGSVLQDFFYPEFNLWCVCSLLAAF